MAFDGSSMDRSALQSRGDKWKKRGDAQFQKQQEYLPLWQAQAEIFYPERADFTTTYSAADERHEGIFTSEPQIMRRDMANNLGAMIRPRGKQWFKCKAFPDHVMKDDEAKRWCEAATATHRNIVYAPAANYSKAMSESDHDYVTFGNAVIAHPYNRDQTGILFSCLHLRDCAWTKNSEGVVDEMHNKMKLTLRQIVQMFGVDNLPEAWKRLVRDEKWSEKLVVRRCVAPIAEEDYEPSDRRMRDAEFASIYIAEDADKDATIAERYFNTFPFTVRSWMDVSLEDYARSPCTSVALADSRTLNISEEALLTGIEWKVRPPMYARDEAIVGELRLEAGAVTYVDDEWDERMGQPIKGMDVGDPRYGIEFRNMKFETLGRAFFQHVLKWMPDKEMTAYETSERLEMYIQEAAPIFEPMEAENAMMMDSVFTRAMNKGAFGRLIAPNLPEGLPEILQDADIRFEFETPLSEALRKMKAAQADQLIARLQGMEELFPDAKDHVNSDQLARDTIEGTSTMEWLATPEEVEEKREARAQAMEQQKAEALAMEAGQAALKANPDNLKTLGKALEEGSVT